MSGLLRGVPDGCEATWTRAPGENSCSRCVCYTRTRTASTGGMRSPTAVQRLCCGEHFTVCLEETVGHTAEDFATYSKDKVDSVHVSTVNTPLYYVHCRDTATLVMTNEVAKLIGTALCIIRHVSCRTQSRRGS